MTKDETELIIRRAPVTNNYMGVAPNPSSAPSFLSNGKDGQVSMNGTRPSVTNVLIDGMDATDPVFGSSPAGASGFFLGLNELAAGNFADNAGQILTTVGTGRQIQLVRPADVLRATKTNGSSFWVRVGANPR